ncbi:MAG: threonine aldolase family protein [Bosea sp. (in: a-proteobacteria)]
MRPAIGNPPADLDFTSDNVAGAAPRVMDAVVAANRGKAAAYGADEASVRVTRSLCELFGREVAVAYLPTGTAANALAAALFVRPWQSILTFRESHLADDECGAPEFFTHGAKIIGLEGVGAKLTPQAVQAQLAMMPEGAMKQMQPALLSISNVTESGLVYRPEEVRALKDVIAPRGLALHMDGARFPNAVVALGCTPADITWKAGVDVLCFGGSKIGGLAAEAVIVFEPEKAREMKYIHKRSGHVLSKMRFLTAQFEALLEGDYWLELAAHANAMASLLAEGVTKAGCRLAWSCEANEVFIIAPAARIAGWRAQGLKAHRWTSTAYAGALAPDEEIIRLVTSFATNREDITAAVELFQAS